MIKTRTFLNLKKNGGCHHLGFADDMICGDFFHPFEGKSQGEGCGHMKTRVAVAEEILQSNEWQGAR